MPVVNYVWDPTEDNIMAEYDDQGGLVARYTTEPEQFGNVISQYRDGQTSYFHHDGIGNTTEVTNDNGDVTDTRAYTAFGEITESTGTTEFPFQFVGQKGYYRDKETGDYSVRRRPYEPAVGRWKSVDPLGIIDATNLFSFVRNNPTNSSDPSGKLTETLARSLFLEPCGAYFVQFMSHLRADERDGFIIQLVQESKEVDPCNKVDGVKECDPPDWIRERLANLPPGALNTGGICKDPSGYFELWSVDSNGTILARDSAPVIVGETDTFSHFGYSTRTRGIQSKSGLAFFISRKQLQQDHDSIGAPAAAWDETKLLQIFKQGSKGGVQQAVTLRSVCFNENVWAFFTRHAYRFRSWHITSKSVSKLWNCCCCDDKNPRGVAERDVALHVTYGVQNIPRSGPVSRGESLTRDDASDAVLAKCTDC